MNNLRIGWLLLVLAFLTLPVCGAEPQLRLITGPDKRPEGVEAIGLSEAQLANLAALAEDDDRWAATLGVYVQGPNGRGKTPAVAGRYKVIGNAIVFRPRYPFLAGVKYDVNFTVPAGPMGGLDRHCALEIAIPPPPPADPTFVTAVYPSANTLPENHLRFYIHFSAPMTAGEAYSHIRLLKTDGDSVSRAFLEIGEELWDGAGQRLTLLFDPGRVKKGLKPREEFGPVLVAGQSYRLIIDKNWRDAHGQPLKADFEKKFFAGPGVEKAVDWKEWKIEAPAAGTREVLVVRFPRPLDRALLLRMISVVDKDNQPLTGEIAVGDAEQRWDFQPRQAWAAGGGYLVVDTTLEDPCGNNLARAFEVDVFEQVDKSAAPEVVRMPFAVRSSK
jgi:hypothetical protein